MKCLIRRVLRRTSAGQVHQDSVCDTETLTLGRATGQQVFLPDMQVALRHAIIRSLSKDHFSLQAVGANQMRVNRRIVQTAVLKPGDEIALGRSRLALIPPPPGHDLALEILPMAEGAAGTHAGAGALTLKATGMSARPFAWLAFLVVIALCLAVPLFIGFRVMDARAHMESSTRGTTAESSAMLANMETTPNLPNSETWSPGPLSNVHRFIGRDCARCHTAPFQPVQNAACLHCHVNLAAHADSDAALSVADLHQARCSACHQEHMGNPALIGTDDRTCTDCHANPHGRMGGSSLPAVKDFASDHPQFRVALLQLDTDWRASTRPASLDEPGLTRVAGLKFPHDVHLTPGGVKRSDGSLENTNCATCHLPDPGKVGFKPITYAAQCQRCHVLSFEPGDPGTLLPHGNAQAAWQFLQGYYSRLALAGGVHDADAPAAVAGYRAPGQPLSGSAREAALGWADGKATSVGREVFTYRLCVGCHQVRDAPAGAAAPWQIAPVVQQDHWFPAAAFNHGAHATMSCDSCHAARRSKTNAEVLMPKIATCRECHAANTASGMQVSSSCITCHAFHKATRHSMAGSLVPADFLVQPLVTPGH